MSVETFNNNNVDQVYSLNVRVSLIRFHLGGGDSTPVKRYFGEKSANFMHMTFGHVIRILLANFKNEGDAY